MDPIIAAGPRSYLFSLSSWRSTISCSAPAVATTTTADQSAATTSATTANLGTSTVAVGGTDKFEKDNKTVRGHLLKHMKDSLFDLFVVQTSAKIIWDNLESRYGQDDAGRKKYVVGKLFQFQMTDEKPIMDQVHEHENLVANVLLEGMKICEVFQANALLEKFPPSWSDYRNHLKHKKKELTLQELINHMRTEEANRQKDKLSSQSLNSVKANLVESSSAFKDRFKNKGKQGFNDRVQNQKGFQIKNAGGKIEKAKLRQDKRPTPQANLAETDDIIAAMVVKANLVEKKFDWILDTRASRHFCSNREIFHDFQDSTDGECVFMGNPTTAGVLGKGKILLKPTDYACLHA
ncbi:uncharacterized protein LOC111024362 [Momordica charantia]|uniref:Uncharacterized protein LOC111024362 n=1 Tax=Momordica charantia TaxID=3673 RepID=A0A6J1DXB7_MOMCH|nr:uncharacterized protein LOC111024362 [Momordica charantia]